MERWKGSPRGVRGMKSLSLFIAQLFQDLASLLGRPPAMANDVLLLGRELGHGLAQLRPLQGKPPLLPVAGPFATEPGRTGARLTTQGLYTQTRVVGQGVKAADTGGLHRLHSSIIFVGVANLLLVQRPAQVGEGYQFPATIGPKLPVFGDLVRIAGRQEEPRHHAMGCQRGPSFLAMTGMVVYSISSKGRRCGSQGPRLRRE